MREVARRSFGIFLRHFGRVRWRPQARSLSVVPRRSVLELTGSDAPSFLHGLATADVCNPTRLVQYSALLNVQGRVLYDVIIYHMGRGRLWVETEADATDEIVRHLRKYILRAKVEFRQLSDVTVCHRLPDEADKYKDHIVSINDPRTNVLGERVLVRRGEVADMKENDRYIKHRLMCGVPEGTAEMPPGKCLPLEMNLDYMSGVSFNKGCYLGQELTSRTYHTGVVRKRIIPLTLEKSFPLSWGTQVTSSTGKTIGKILGCYESYAIALLRLPDLVDGETLNVVVDEGNISANWSRPSWWPVQQNSVQ